MGTSFYSSVPIEMNTLRGVHKVAARINNYLLISNPKERPNCHRTDCHEISNLELVLKFSELFRFSLKPYKCKILGVVMHVQLCYLAVDYFFNRKTRKNPEPKRKFFRSTSITNKIHFNIYHIFYIHKFSPATYFDRYSDHLQSDIVIDRIKVQMWLAVSPSLHNNYKIIIISVKMI